MALLLQHPDRGGALLTVTHDLEVARALGGDVWVMQQAHVVENGDAEQVLARPWHAYTRRLVAAEPSSWRYAWQEASHPGPEAPALIEARDLRYAYGSNRLFDSLSLDVGAGERLALTGPSGSGKTTLGNVLLRLQRPDGGSVRHADSLGPGRVQKLYQDPAASFPRHVTTGIAIADVLRRHRLDASRLDELVETMHLPPGVLSRRPGQVSGGELQRLALIRALLLRPLLLFADEPTSRLDLVTQQETVHCLMQQVDEAGCALILVTHDQVLAAAVAARTVAVGPASARRGVAT
ncbi:ATP-binding cassette domain-containing protein [Nocardioides sp.]|uniref:ATP-binding cassette domain-containing protein n=1 Tax=Nocardioides sp. TaxID=35761 RepID=UPI002B26BF0E|nr:ATP-binding cassette domain-containing protein [Nocardioides sp.]